MNYNLKATDVTITDDIRTYLEKKLTHLEKFVQKASAALIATFFVRVKQNG